MKKSYIISGVVAIVALIAIGVCYWLMRPTKLEAIVPANSVAVAKVDFAKIASGKSDSKAIANLLGVDALDECGIDFSQPAYIFESEQGLFGMVAAIADNDATEQWIGKLAKKGLCTDMGEKNGVKYTTFANMVLAGFNGKAMIMVGPVVATSETENLRKIVKYLEADEDDSIMSTKLYEKLNAMDGGMITMVAQSSALPKRTVAPFTLGAPSSSSPTDICLAATLNVIEGKYLAIEGEAFSFDSEIDKSLKLAANTYKKVKGTYLPTISENDAIVVSCNIAGREYVKLLRSNPTLRTILVGLNTTLDINKMLDGVAGDILVKGNFDDKGNITPTLLADAVNDDWLADVDYWKKSCPSGTTISNGSTPQSFRFTSQDYHIDFGLTDGGKTLYFVPSSDTPLNVLEPAAQPLPKEIVEKMQGGRLCAIANIGTLLRVYGGETATNLAKPILGNINTIVIGVK